MKKLSFHNFDPEDALKLAEALDENKEDIIYKLEEKEKRKKKKMLSDEQIKRIKIKGIKKEVDKETYLNNLIKGSCKTCIKDRICYDDKIYNRYSNCEKWDYILSCKEI